MIETGSPTETRRLGALIGAGLSSGDVIALFGELGAGKTVLVKGIAEGLSVEDPEHGVVSPSFTLINMYPADIPLYHFDLFRLEGTEQFLEIGGEEFLYGDGVSLIEWADRCPDVLPGNAMKVRIEVAGETRRKFCLEGFREEILQKISRERRWRNG